MKALAFSLVFPRTEKAAAAASDDRDLFVTGQFQRTLAELDGDLDGKNDPPTRGRPAVWQRRAVCNDPTWCAGGRAPPFAGSRGVRANMRLSTAPHGVSSGGCAAARNLLCVLPIGMKRKTSSAGPSCIRETLVTHRHTGFFMNMSSLSISQENAGHAPGWGPFVMQQLTPAVLGVHLGARHREARAGADRLLVKARPGQTPNPPLCSVQGHGVSRGLESRDLFLRGGRWQNVSPPFILRHRGPAPCSCAE